MDALPKYWNKVLKIDAYMAGRLFSDGWVTCPEGHWDKMMVEGGGECPSCCLPLIIDIDDLAGFFEMISNFDSKPHLYLVKD